MRGTERFDATAATGAARLGRGLAVALTLGSVLVLAGVGPARAYQLTDFLKKVVPGQTPAQTTTTPTTLTTGAGAAKPAATAPGAPGAMAMQQGPADLPPLHKLGTDAVAVVEAATPKASVREMDYVFAKQNFTVGPKGSVTLSYLSGCLTEVIQGGTVTVAATGSHVVGGKLLPRPTPGCKAPHPIILASASEAGATVNRITPFTGVVWDERALKSGPPVFKWDKALGAVTLRVKDLEKSGDPVIWQAATDRDWIAYPVKGVPPLAPGEPFKAEAVAGDKVVASAIFSISPDLDEADNLANRVVPLSAP
ncbi:hypothetical protein [Phenylobacterium sp.]|uniref:hypothetical protein n=1 Tax=Phenylobacterium sp. TaxID=1871053 RepID=UPI0012019CA9|nr:hypothetical protein [Phenylobacterium sp.]THD58420.1 MAG: hypothetical protein E8A49_19625 [Phenylobacterium sp.]